MVLREGMKLALVGVLLGLGAAALASDLVAGLLYDVSVEDRLDPDRGRWGVAYPPAPGGVGTSPGPLAAKPRSVRRPSSRA